MFYGYKLREKRGEPLENIINSVMCAKSFADYKQMPFCFIKEEYDVSIFDTYKDERVCKAWLTYMNGFSIKEYEDCSGIWPSYEMDKIHKTFTMKQFINKDIDLEKYSKIYKEENRIVSIPDFVSKTILEEIRVELETYPWWHYCIVPSEGNWDMKLYYPHDPSLKERFNECETTLLNKEFTYRFKRTFQDHYESCNCVNCRLRDTVSSSSFMDTICKIIGSKRIEPNEIFLSDYCKNDFLSQHHDSGKGDIAVTLYFTYDWDPVYGGILHFCDENNDIYKSIVPRLGSLNIFHVSGQEKKNHFVSHVTVNKHRIGLSVWYTILE
jgi:Rps23 Pro-64 3,4-dihydroxylase Tpa1-like proline 4-hydroxylase